MEEKTGENDAEEDKYTAKTNEYHLLFILH